MPPSETKSSSDQGTNDTTPIWTFEYPLTYAAARARVAVAAERVTHWEDAAEARLNEWLDIQFKRARAAGHNEIIANKLRDDLKNRLKTEKFATGNMGEIPLLEQRPGHRPFLSGAFNKIMGYIRSNKSLKPPTKLPPTKLPPILQTKFTAFVKDEEENLLAKDAKKEAALQTVNDATKVLDNAAKTLQTVNDATKEFNEALNRNQLDTEAVNELKKIADGKIYYNVVFPAPDKRTHSEKRRLLHRWESRIISSRAAGIPPEYTYNVDNSRLPPPLSTRKKSVSETDSAVVGEEALRRLRIAEEKDEEELRRLREAKEQNERNSQEVANFIAEEEYEGLGKRRRTKRRQRTKRRKKSSKKRKKKRKKSRKK